MAIDWSKVSIELKQQFEARLPAGLTLDNVRLADARVVKVEQVASPTGAEQVLTAAMEQAGGPSMITNGKPTILRIVAWMAHEGINKNRLAFITPDLEQAAAKIAEPNFLPMDFNHSAILPGFGDQKAIGLWYKAEIAQDPEANDAMGILATGIMWSWLNPEIANTLLAEQARNGKMDFSMACICGSVVRKFDDNGPYEEAQDTTFFTLSALDVPPADPAARGKGVEGSQDPKVERDLRQELLNANVPVLALAADGRVPLGLPNGGRMDELIEHLKTLAAKASEIADSKEKATILAAIEAVDEKVTSLADQLPDKITPTVREVELETQVSALEKQVEELTAELEAAKIAQTAVDPELEAKLSEANLAKEALTISLEAANAEVERLTAELATANEQLASYKGAEAEKASAERLAARIAELPAPYIQAFEARTEEEQTKTKARWADMTDEQWTAFTNDLGVLPIQRSYLTRSAEEGRLPQSKGTKPGSVSERLAQFKN